MSTDDYDGSKDVFECTVQLAHNLEYCFLPITETNLESIEILKNAVSLCKLLKSTDNEILDRNTNHIIQAFQKLITGIFMISLESHLDGDLGVKSFSKVQTQAILFSKSMSVRVGSDIERLLKLNDVRF